MNDVIKPNKSIRLSVTDKNDQDKICKIAHAISVPDRVKILRSMNNSTKSIAEISQELNIPSSSVARHIDILADAELIIVKYLPGPKGHTKYCSPIMINCNFNFVTVEDAQSPEQEYSVELPVGLFSHCHIKTPCGMAGKEGPIGMFDNPRVFFEPERLNAECIWFDMGFVSYNFPTTPITYHECSEISFSFEICSETVYYNNVWPSDITVFINDVEVTTFTSPGDFGGRRGRFTPQYWPITNTQFGLLKKITVNGRGVWVDNAFVHNHVTFDDLKLYDGTAIKLTIGIKEDAKHRGGINLFGKNFGDYPQAIVMTVK